jgi:hypothetical protein
MRDAYKKRKDDFKRRILKTNIIREKLFQEEQRWLSMIKAEEIKTRYYNLCLVVKNPWWNEENNRKTVGEKIAAALKASDKNKDKNGVRPAWNKGKRGVQVAWNKGKKMKPHSEESKELIKKSSNEYWAKNTRKHSEESKELMRVKHLDVPLSEKTKKKMSRTHKQRCQSLEVRKQLSYASKCRWEKYKQ